MAEMFIWITRWEDFQHYPPERDRAPAWVKTYTKQLDDDDYRNLTADQRGLLHDLRIAFARSRGRLAMDTRGLAHRFGYRVLTPQLKRLSDAGFILFLSREGLEAALESFYASRAPARSRRSKKLEEEKDTRAVTSKEDVALDAVNGTAQGVTHIGEFIDRELAKTRGAP